MSQNDSSQDLPEPSTSTSTDPLSNGDMSLVNLDSNVPNPVPAFNISVPEEASDTDLIEKEWVERAKQIVDHTREDPYEQQKALSQMKADYMKKRYNKDIKLPEA